MKKRAKIANICAFVAFCAGLVASAHAGDVTENGVRTLTEGAAVTVATEAALGTGVTNVIVDASTLTFSLASDQAPTSVVYQLRNNGALAVTPAARTLTLQSPRLITPSAGGTFEKAGPGTLALGVICNPVTSPTRFVVREGTVRLLIGDHFGNHQTTTTNLVIDVREGATWHNGTTHAAVGPVELTGATWRSDNNSPYNNYWADTSFKSEITAHASSTPSKMYATSWFFLGQPLPDGSYETNRVINVEEGAELFVYGQLRQPSGYGSRLVKRGGGTLYLMAEGSWPGGTVIEGGKIVLGHEKALGSKPVTVAGDVGLSVVPGLTVAFPEVKGTGTVTVEGQGGITFGTVASTVTGATSKAADPTYSPVADGVLRLTAMSQAVNVPAGQTVTVTDVTATYDGLAEVCDIRKTGGGTLVLGTGLRGKYRAVIVEEGVVAFADETCFGSVGTTGIGGVTVKGGTIRPTKSLKQASVRVTYDGAGGLDVPAGVTFTATSNFLYTASAKVTKTGAGTWAISTFTTPLARVSGTTWVIDEGLLQLTGSGIFGAHSVCWPGTIEIHENGEMAVTSTQAHNPMGPLVLRGGTLRAPIAQFSGTAFYTDGGMQWGGYAFNGGITVKASSKPSRIIGRVCFTGHESFIPVFDVEAGAVLDVDSSLRRGATYASGGYAYADGTLVKAGAGTLRLRKPLSLTGRFDIQGGTVELAEGGYVDPSAQVFVREGAKFLLNDGTRVVSSATALPGIVGDAEVWMDATRIAANDGATLSTIANLGTSGGKFAKFPKAVNAKTGMIPNAPKYVAAGKGIGGKASVGFDGTMALALDSYVNKGTNCEVFVVACWTNYVATGGQGKWGGIVSLGSTAMTGNEDQHNWGVLSTSCSDGTDGAISGISVYFGPSTADYGGDKETASISKISPTIANDEPFILRVRRGDTSGESELWRSDAIDVKTGGSTYSTRTCRVDRVAIGTRLMTGGCATTYTSASPTATRNLIGQIGEVLVFSRALSTDERAAVNDYLRRKWIGTSAAQPQSAERLRPADVEVETPAGASAAFAVGSAGADAVNVVKSGAGEVTLCGGDAAAEQNVSVNAGAVRLQDAALSSRVAVWVDADDASACVLDADGYVTNLVNKGACGGSFVRSASRGNAPHCPKRNAEGLNGHATLTFDGETALMTDVYTNKVASRRVSVYAVARRNRWELHPKASNGGGYGKWACVFTLVSTTGSQDESDRGVFHLDEQSLSRASADFGTANVTLDTPPTGEPYLFVGQVTTNGYYLSYETNATNVAKVPRTVNGDPINLEPLNVERIILGGRCSSKGRVHYYAKDSTSNRCWYGDLAELIVTTEPLSFDEEIELLGYLRKKWMNKGDGSATPPAWLAGTPAAPQFGDKTTLALANGTTLVDAADELTLGALETQGTTTWVREWDGTEENYAFFTVAGAVSLGSVRLPLAATPTYARILSYGSTAAAPAWSVVRPSGRVVSATVFDRESAYWLGKGGTAVILK